MSKSTGARTGLVICALLGLLDVAGVAALGADGAPPLAIGLGAGAFGLITLVAMVPAWRGNRPAVLTVIASRLLSLLLGIPVFFTDSAPGWARVAVGAAFALTLLGVGLIVLSGRKAEAQVSS